MSRLSGSHFAALFKSRIGYPALQYQTQLRMARARELLDTTDQAIAAVAASTGLYRQLLLRPPVQEGARGTAVRAPGAAEGSANRALSCGLAAPARAARRRGNGLVTPTPSYVVRS
ncbi:hypothetical protein B7495_17120 [Cryobacterium sp. LW097]|uniref:helix-turn-helix domain-containing protein n=1 Tax=Cryobacterium sp. LW097 TaxID=1978566 RepID=UPI000B4DD4D9|nr:hypothetical protein B7495_17120 [Cryobacterium sp. LW097]